MGKRQATARSLARGKAGRMAATKRAGEAKKVAPALLQTAVAVAQPAGLDVIAMPQEMHEFLTLVTQAYAAEKRKNPSLPDLEVADDKTALRVIVKKDDQPEDFNIPEQEPERRAKATSSDISMGGEAIDVSPDQTKTPILTTNNPQLVEF